MRILFLHEHFYPETVGTSTRAVEIVEYLVKRGHDVTVVTGLPCHPSTMRNGEVSRDQPREEMFRGARIHRVWTFGSPKPDKFWRRMLTYSSFMILGGLKALRVRGPFDALVAISPLPNGISGLIVSKIRRFPLMFDVCDIWPDCAVAVDMLTNPLLVRMAFWIEKKIYSRARRVGVVTRGFTENLAAKGVPREKIALLPDWVDPETYDSSRVNREAVRAEYGFGEKFVVSFLGNFGLLMGLETIMETARVAKGRAPGVLFLFVGKGAALPMMEEKIAEWGLDNVRIIPYQPRDKVPGLLAASDALIVTYKKTPITRITVPSKIYEYMASERPIVAGVDGVIGEILAEAGCGLASPARDPEEMAGHILKLQSDPELRREMGRKGRAYVASHFSFERVSADYESAITQTAKPAANP
ncbi:MAG: glycosyltransferase family 4 protein [Candidatus Sumerlaeaceae bacterium]|nr:glycosyltransferase family 4 protein [Candidatus Sumerlaeaceae bacterium]